MKDEVLLGCGVHSNVRQLPVDQLAKSPTTLKLMCQGWEQLHSLSEVMIYVL